MKQKVQLIKGIKLIIFTMFTLFWLSSTVVNAQEVISTNRTGTQDGWYWSFWKDNGSASMTLYPGGRYTTTWNGVNNFTAGKGWAVGSASRSICFEGSYNGGTNGFLAVYGWTKNPLIEYYVVENHGQWVPPGGTSKGTFTSDGGTYNIYETTRTNQPSIIGTATFQQYWAVRSTKRSSGTVTFANHVAAWKAKGMNMGTTWDYQIIESEGYQSTGNSDITILNCSSCSATTPTVASPTITYEQGATPTQLKATGTNLKWYTTETGGTGNTTAPTPSTSAVGTTVYYVASTGTNCESSRASITVNVVTTYQIFKVASALTIDGTMENVWSDASVKSINATKLLSGTVSNSTDASGYAKLLYDNTNLYFLAVITDEVKQNDSENSYDDDQVELYIDANNAKATTYDANDCQYSFGWNDGTVVGTIPAAASKSGITYAAVATANGYIIEAKLPWSTINGTATADKLLGIDFMINDDDNNGTRDAKLAWNSATDEAYANASLFGTAKLMSQQLVVTGTEDFSTESISIFPNPSANDLYITGFANDFEYVICDNAGRTIMEGQSTNKINIAKLETGAYILKVKQGDRYKIIKISKL